ncbi:MAG: M23 family metallopeptidase [Candidatus Puniceispirillum sp.]|nr:M23 family metallopeptidase [Candidatus Puniceispirillum sp.]MBL6774539.1 M23 family metallopeptidase [Candidatus Puniceispirillum sp.]
MKLPSQIARFMSFCRTHFLAILVLAMTNAAASPLRAQNIDGAEILSGTAIEGGLIIARTNPANRILLDDNAIEIAENGVFVIGFHRDSDVPVSLRIIGPDGTMMISNLTPHQRDYNIQRIDGLNQTMVTPPANVLARIKADGKAVRAAREQETPLGDFWRGFDWPARGRISGVYGSQRILNGKSRQPHYGIDIAAPRGTPVRAPASGKVTLVKDLYFSGWTIVIAHGLGVNSSFLHLDQVDVKAGMMIKRGDLIGTIGATGRATGPHLDWRIDWQGRRIDPGLLVSPMPNPAS